MAFNKGDRVIYVRHSQLHTGRVDMVSRSGKLIVKRDKDGLANVVDADATTHEGSTIIDRG